MFSNCEKKTTIREITIFSMNFNFRLLLSIRIFSSYFFMVFNFVISHTALNRFFFFLKMYSVFFTSKRVFYVLSNRLFHIISRR